METVRRAAGVLLRDAKNSLNSTPARVRSVHHLIFHANARTPWQIYFRQQNY